MEHTLSDRLVLHNYIVLGDTVRKIENKINNIVDTVNQLHLVKPRNVSRTDGFTDNPVRLSYSEKSTIKSYVSVVGKKLSNDFFDFGRLRHSRNSANQMVGTESEKRKYDLCLSLPNLIEKYNSLRVLEKNLAGLTCVKLVLSNDGMEPNEDIEITLVIHADRYVPFETLFDSDVAELLSAYDDEGIAALFAIDRTSDCLNFSKSQTGSCSTCFSDCSPFADFLPANTDFSNRLKRFFFYDVFHQTDNIILKLRYGYIRQHTAVAFPSVIFVDGDLDEIEYRITSKNYPGIIEGVLKK
ncbi:hypothetical protein SAMN02910436_02879 [Ruminococcaceae bacterium P7]|nr:hypothetical protein SAMN02910436_02879 [Ruminococcaceae bacterium P7]